MKNLGSVIALGLMMFLVLTANGQKLSKNFLAHKEREFTKQEIDALKNTTTLFALRDQDWEHKALFEQAIRAAWSFTKVKIIQYEELATYKNSSYSYFVLQGYNTNVSSSTVAYDLPHLYLTLKYEDINYCRIEMFTNLGTMNILSGNLGQHAIQIIYASSVIKNWSPGHLYLYLANVQKNLNASKREYLYESEVYMDALKELTKKDTLYVPDYVGKKFNKWTGDESNRHDMDKLFKSCPMTVKVVSPLVLWEKMAKNQVVYVFDYVKSCTDNYVRVYNVKEGKMYQAYRPVSYNLKAKDIKKVFK